MVKVTIKRLSGLRETAKKWEIGLKNDVWNGKPPFRYVDIGHSVASRRYL